MSCADTAAYPSISSIQIITRLCFSKIAQKEKDLPHYGSGLTNSIYTLVLTDQLLG